MTWCNRVYNKEQLCVDTVMRSGVFEVDSEGRVWRLMYGRRSIPRQRAEVSQSAGYHAIRFMHNGKQVEVLAHRLVWHVSRGEIPGKMVINHMNGNKKDNRLENLEVVTHAENMRHAHRTGLSDNSGENNGHAKLTKESVREIRSAYSAGGVMQKELASSYGVARSMISLIISGKNWKDS